MDFLDIALTVTPIEDETEHDAAFGIIGRILDDYIGDVRRPTMDKILNRASVDFSTGGC